jgi:glutathione S-transferase
MALTFYCGSGSAFAWRVWLALEHKGIPYELKLLSFAAGDHKKPEFLAINPRHKVPAIVDGDLKLYESQAIVEYLGERYADHGAALWPTDVVARATARRLVAEADHYLYPALRPVMGLTLFSSTPEIDAGALDHAVTDLGRELERWTGPLANGFAGGSKTATAGDFAVYPILASIARVDARFPQSGAMKVVPAEVKAYMQRMEELPVVQKTWPPHWKA